MTDVSSSALAPGVSHTDALPSGTRLGEFEIESLLGVGGFGMVYKAFDHSLHRAVAIKEYMPAAMVARAEGQSVWVRSSADQPVFQAGLASFVAEARLLAQFDHPSLVKVFRFWEANSTAYMVMPLYSGMTLKQARTQMLTPPSEEWLRKVLWSILGALRVLHEGNTLHRDISPDNIFLQYSGPPVLLDLGAARHAINDQDRHHTAVLKVNYAPIEQYAQGSDDDLRQGPWSDLYSLAAVVHGCLCNDTPLPATLRAIRDRMVPFSRVAKTVKRQFGVSYSPAFVATISQSLALRPQERLQSIDAFLQAMEMTVAPVGTGSFDFRRDLGDNWIAAAGRPDIDLTMPAADGLPAVPEAASAPVELPDPALLVAAASAPVVGVTVNTPAVVPESPSVDVPPAVPAVDSDAAGDTVFMDAPDTVMLDDVRAEVPAVAQHLVAGGASVASTAPAAASARFTGDGVARSAAPLGSSVVRKSRMAMWLALAVLLVVSAAAGVRWSQQSQAVQDEIITEMADPPTPAASATSAPAADTSLTDLGTPSAATSGSATTAAPAPAFVVAPASRPVARTAPRPAPLTAAVPEAPPEPAPTATAPAPAEIAETRPRPARAPTPQEVCADANFLSRPLCIHQECQKPSQASRPICVETRLRYEADEQRRRQTPN